MTRRFVIGLADLPEEDRNQVRDYLGRYGLWWNWIKNMFLFVTEDQAISAETIRDRMASLGIDRIIVFEFPEEITWAGHGPAEPEGRNMFKWLHKTWDK
jgi:hypothetical protein